MLPERAQTQRRTVFTGYPPPLEQVARQVRSSSGATYCAQVGAKGPTTPTLFKGTAVAPPAVVATARPEAPKSLPYHLTAKALLAVLQELDAAKQPMPALSELAEMISSPGNARHIGSNLVKLEKAGRITMWRGAARFRVGEYVIRIVGSDHEMRTAGAPADAHAPICALA